MVSGSVLSKVQMFEQSARKSSDVKVHPFNRNIVKRVAHPNDSEEVEASKDASVTCAKRSLHIDAKSQIDSKPNKEITSSVEEKSKSKQNPWQNVELKHQGHAKKYTEWKHISPRKKSAPLSSMGLERKDVHNSPSEMLLDHTNQDAGWHHQIHTKSHAVRKLVSPRKSKAPSPIMDYRQRKGSDASRSETPLAASPSPVNAAQKYTGASSKTPVSSPRHLHPALRHASPNRMVRVDKDNEDSASKKISPQLVPAKRKSIARPVTPVTKTRAFLKAAEIRDVGKHLSSSSLSRSRPSAPELSRKSPSSSVRSLSSRATRYFGGSRTASHPATPTILRQNLNAASVVIEEEKASSTGSTSSSRSSLSNVELGNIAKRAMFLSRESTETRAKRMEKSPLGQMLQKKRAPKITVYGNPGSMEKSLRLGRQSNDSSTVSSRVLRPALQKSGDGDSSKKSSSRMTRAQRVAALKRHNKVFAPSPVYDGSMATSTLSSDGLGRNKSSAEESDHGTRRSKESDQCVNESPESLRRMQRQQFIKQISQPFPVMARHNKKDESSPAMTDLAEYGENNLNDESYSDYSTDQSESSVLSPNQSNSSFVETDDVQPSATDVTDEDHVKYPVSGVKVKEASYDYDQNEKFSSVEKLHNTAVISPRICDRQSFDDEHDSETDTLEHSSFLREDTVFTYTDVSPRRSYPANIPSFRDGKNPQPRDVDGPAKATRSTSRSASVNSALRGEEIPQYKSDGSELVYSSNSGSNSLTVSSSTRNSTTISSSTNSKSSSSIPSLSNKKALHPADNQANSQESHLSYTESSSAPNTNRDLGSSGSQTSKEDAMRWWQKTYGNKVSGDTNEMVRNVFAGVSNHVRHAPDDREKARQQTNRKTEKVSDTPTDNAPVQRNGEPFKKKPDSPQRNQILGSNDDDEDIFFGLDDESKASRSSNAGPSSRNERKNAIYTDHSTPVETRGQSQKVNYQPTSPLSRLPVTRVVPKNVVSENIDSNPLSPLPVNSPRHYESGRHSGMVLDGAHKMKAVTSDITSSLIGGTFSKNASSYNPDFAVRTIQEENVPDENMIPSCEEDIPSVEREARIEPTLSEDNSITLDGSAGSKKTDTKHSVLSSIGAVLVNSIDNACRLPDKGTPCIQSNARAAIKDRVNETGTRCKEGCTGFPGDSTVLDEEETFYKGDEPSYVSTVHTNMDSTLETVYTTEYTATAAAQAGIQGQVSASSREDASALLHVNKTLSSSILNNTDRQAEQHKERRQLAQNRLLDHARKAIWYLNEQSGPAVESREAESASASTQAAEQELDVREPPTPVKTPRTLAAEISEEERVSVARFSSQLRSHGIEVLKLNRRSKWQTRYLTVSRDKAATVENIVCPKALLWLKNPPSQGQLILEENDEGRGGFCFEMLASIETKFNSEPPCPIPKKFRKAFPDYAGVVVEYDCDDGLRTLTLCFQSRVEASSFWTAVKVLREVVSREEGIVHEEKEIVNELA